MNMEAVSEQEDSVSDDSNCLKETLRQTICCYCSRAGVWSPTRVTALRYSWSGRSQG